MDVRVGLWRRLSAKELMLLNCGVRVDSWESLGLWRYIEPVWIPSQRHWSVPIDYALLHFLKGPAYAASSVQFSCSVMPDSWQSHEPQHARPPCPSPSPRVYPNSCPSSRWCHPAISSSVFPFSSCPQFLPASGSFSMSQFFASGGQSIGSFSFNISPTTKHPGLISFRMDWLDLLAVQGTLKSSPTPQFKSINSLVLSFLYSPTLTSIHNQWKNLSLE